MKFHKSTWKWLSIHNVLAMTAFLACMVFSVSSAGASPLKQVVINGDKVAVEDMSPTPVEGLYRLRLAGGTVVYSDAKAHYLITGDMYENTSHGLVNMSELHAAQERKAALASLDPKRSINFRSANHVKAVLTVFTDVTCPYCQQLHGDVASLNQQGIEVRYLSFPRAGENSPAAAEMAQVWCSKNPQESMTNAFNGQSPSNAGAQCRSMINADYELGKRLGVQGTPAIIYPDGTLQNGYLPESQMLEQLKKHM